VATGGRKTSTRILDPATWQFAAEDYAVKEARPTLDELFDDGDRIDEALREAVRDARRFHKALGHPMATWIDGHVVWIEPEDIRIDDEAAE
jgi:hypothetical protein